nr:zinc finger, SWIM-type [Tanacetum cinerariifolium]
LLSKDEGMLATFMEQLKTIKQEVQVQVPKPPLQKTCDVIEDIYAIEKPRQNDVNIPQRARNKGGRRGERRKSRREIELKDNTKQIQKCYAVERRLTITQNEGMLATFMEQLKTIKQEVQVQVPKPPLQKTCDVIEDIYAIEKPRQNDVNIPQRARNKGGRRGERRKSRREIELKDNTKQIQKCYAVERRLTITQS